MSAWLWSVFFSASAKAQDPATFTAGGSICPDPAAVESAVLNLVPPDRQAILRQDVRIQLDDAGDGYTVSVTKADAAQVTKNYTDFARDCDTRARFAAVFVVLTVFPPEVDLELPKPPAPPPRPPPPHPAALPKPRRRVSERAQTPVHPALHAEVSVFFAGAPPILDAPSMTTSGAELRLVLGSGALRGTLAGAYAERSQFELDGVHGDFTRIPTSAGLRWHVDQGAWALEGDLALLLAFERVRGTGLAEWRSHQFLELGGRAGLSIASVVSTHFAPFVGAFAWVVPGPRELSVLPRGQLGNLPYLWLGAAAGVSFGL